VSSRPRLLLLAACPAAVIAIVLLAVLAPRSARSPARSASQSAARGGAFAGAELPGAVRAPDLTLSDQSGRRVSLSALRGQVTLLAFVSTSCAPACVLVAQQIRGALDELARRPAVLLVSVDPATDTPARVSGFLARTSLAGRVHFLTGALVTLRAIWRLYGVRPIGSGRVSFERSAEVRLIDGAGRERVIFGLEQLTPEGLAHDVRKLF
jgi:protein SCO1/2